MLEINTKIEIGDFNFIFNWVEKINPTHILLLTSKSIGGKAEFKEFNINIGKICKISLFNKIKPDAPVDDLDYIHSNFSKPDLIIAIGGGSVLDSAKAISICWQGNSVSDYLYQKVNIPQEKICLLAVPSTAGSGSEMSSGAILFDKTNNFKGGIRSSKLIPDYVILNYDLYKMAPSILIAECGFDALTHAIETYLSKKSNDIIKLFSVNAIKIIFSNLVNAFKGDSAALSMLAINSAFLGINLANSSTCLPHRIQYIVGPKTNTSHAQGLIALYNGWLPLISKTTAYKKLEYDCGLEIGGLAKKIFDIKEILQVNYRLSDFGITKSDIPELATLVSGNLELDPCYQDEKTIIQILNLSL